MKVCYILCYYFPEYVRTKTLVNGLVGIQNVQLTKLLNKHSGWFRYIETLVNLIRIRIINNPEIYILGFRGYEIYWLVRWITRHKILIIDHMMSPYDSLIFEKKTIKEKSLLGKIVYRYEKGILETADGILTDTTNHKNLFVELFGVKPEKIYPVHVSTDEDLFKPYPHNKTQCFEVFFYGSFLPLHGVIYILQAANLVRDLPIHFHLVGGHKTDLRFFYRELKALELSHISHTPWIEYKNLPAAISQADICLGGPFGNTGQAERVITGKTFQFLAMEKPTVVSVIEPNQGFLDKYNCLVVPRANSFALAEAILWAYNHQDALTEIASLGRDLYLQNFSNQVVTGELKKLLDEI